MNQESPNLLGKHRKTEDGKMLGEERTEVEVEEEYGKRVATKKRDPKELTKNEREDHDKTHMPFQSWCRHCVRGREKEEACR